MPSFSDVVKVQNDRKILMCLLPELQHLSDNHPIQIFREWILKTDKVKFTIYWKDFGKTFRLTCELPYEMSYKEPQFWKLENLELVWTNIND